LSQAPASPLSASQLNAATIETYIESAGLSETSKRHYEGTLKEAEKIAEAPLGQWSRGHVTQVRLFFEKNGKNRTPEVKWNRVKSFFIWATKTKRLDEDVTEGEPIGHREDPPKPFIRPEDTDRLERYLESRSKPNAPGSTETRRRQDALMLKEVRLIRIMALRGGELLPSSSGESKTICSCGGAGDCSERNPAPHDFKFLSTNLVRIRIKGEPHKIRFKEVRLRDDEIGSLKEVIANPCWVLRTFNNRLKDIQGELKIVLIDRSGNPDPTAPLTSHSFRRGTATTMLIDDKQPVPVINKVMGWTKNSRQSLRYGEPTTDDADAAVRKATRPRRAARTAANEKDSRPETEKDVGDDAFSSRAPPNAALVAP